MRIFNRCGYSIMLEGDIELSSHTVTHVDDDVWKRTFVSRKTIRDAVASGHLLVMQDETKNKKEKK